MLGWLRAVPGPIVTAPTPGRRPRRRRARPTRQRRRARLGLLLVAVVVVAVVCVLALSGGGIPAPPAAGVATEAHSTDPFSYATARAADFTARATAGNARPLFSQSPGGALATARRVAAYRPAINRAVQGTGIDPNLLEGLVFVESAGRPNAIAGSDPVAASGLTQILAATGQTLLGMHIDLPRSRQLTRQIDAVAAGVRKGDLAALQAQRAAVDTRFDPGPALAATVRYLRDAERQFGRQDLAFESYHMGIGNLQRVLSDYDGGHPAPYVQLYFDVGPDHHASAFRLLSSFGDDSSLYWWRILGAEQIMHLYRTDGRALSRLSALALSDAAGASLLHPPGRVPRFADPAALSAGYRRRTVVPLPRNASALGLAYDPGMGSGASAVAAPRALYRGLTPVALRLLIELAGRIRSISAPAPAAPLRVASTVADARYLAQAGTYAPLASTGYAFSIDRRYRSDAQAEAFQELLDRLQSLHLITWVADGTEIDITVASDASSWRG